VNRFASVIALLTLAAWSVAARAQQPDTASGYVIRDQTVIASCGSCHRQDSTGRMGRLSYMRKTPEGWEASVRRMIALNDVRLDPAAARAVVKYFANNQGIAPAELAPGRFEVERRMVDYTYAADSRTERTCRACHSMGRVITQRRTRDEWALLVATHRGYYPGVDNQGFRSFGGGDSTPQHPMDNAISHLARAFPLKTPEWTAWSATMRPPPLEGEWLIAGSEAGRGRFFGRLTVSPSSAAADEFTTRATYTYGGGGATVAREGRVIVYTGYQWRGRSAESNRREAEPWREVMTVEPGWQTMSGRWFTGGYDETGIDVTAIRVGRDVVVAGVLPRALRTAGAHDVTVFGANLPGTLQPAAVSFGPGVQVERIVRATPDSVTVRVRVDSAAAPGERDLFVAGSALRGAVAVYDRISRIKVAPLAGMARVGGVVFPKQLQQFEAVAFHDGADGRADTPDDIDLGPVAATWAVEEYGATYDDDDIKWVGTIDARGLFTPAEDGPNPRRKGNRNNIGDVWVVATHRPSPSAPPLRARAHLVVTVPLYMRWEPFGSVTMGTPP
jgi:quinohemoprotein amine dehydrogenase